LKDEPAPEPFVLAAAGGDPRRSAPHVARNVEPIAEVLRGVLPEGGLVLEIASGTGEHALYLAHAFPGVTWQPSDPDPVALASIAAWREAAEAPNLQAPNLQAPVQLDAAAEHWPIAAADAILCINMVHISPWSATEGLMRGGGQLLPSGAPLILYGPYRRAGIPTAPSNEAFDASLQARNPQWGLRNLEAVQAEADRNGLSFERLVEMPANNLTLVFRRG
jgi:SAM-dependent methyltransferase